MKPDHFNDRWYFGAINRRRANELLAAENNVAGSFLVRDSDQVIDSFSAMTLD